MSFLARATTPADGSQTVFPVPFELPPSQGRDGVSVYVHPADEEPDVAEVVDTDYSWTSDGVITFLSPPTAGLLVDIRRETDISEIDHPLQAGGTIKSSELADNDQQLLCAVQEITDVTTDLNTRSIRCKPGQTFAAIDKTTFAGKFWAGDASGNPIPVDSVGGADATLRSDLATMGGALVAYVAAGAGAVSRTITERLSSALSPEDFGAQGAEGVDDTEALNLWSAACAELGVVGELGPKTYYCNEEGVLFPMGTLGNTIYIRGQGPKSEIKRLPVAAGEMTDTNRVCKFEATEGGCYVFENWQTNGNEANVVDYDVGDLYEFEHAHNVIFVAGVQGPSVVLGDIITINFSCINAVGDGFSHNWPHRNFFHDNFREDGRTRRVRSGMQLGIFSGLGVIKGGSASYLECEPVSALNANHLLVVDGFTCTENIDLAGFSTAFPLNVVLIGVKSLLSNPLHPGQRFSLAYLKGEAHGCHFKGTDMVYGRSQIFQSQLDVYGGSLTIPVNPSDATQAIPVRWLTEASSRLRFFGTYFAAPAGITSTANYAIPAAGGGGNTQHTGTYLMPANLSTTGTETIEFHDCISDENLPHFFDAYQCGTVWVDGGTPRGKTSVIRYVTTTGKICNVTITRPEQFPKAGLGKLFAFSGSTGNGTIKLSGSFDGELMAPVADGTNPTGVTWDTAGAIMFVDSTPAARIRGIDGLKARLRSAAAGALDEWTYRNGGVPGSTAAWEARLQKAVTSSATYVAAAGGVTIDAEARAAQVQLAADLANMKLRLQNAGLMA